MSNLLTALPTHFAGRRIVERLPFSMPGELVVPTQTNQRPFPQGTFTYNADLVIEITSVGFAIQCLDTNSAVIATPAAVADTLRMVRCRMNGFGKTRELFKATQLIASLVDSDRIADNGVWSLDCPNYLINGQGWSVEIDNGIPTANSVAYANVAVAFRGSQLVLE